MAEPTSKTTRSKRGMRRSHHAVKKFVFAKCQHCGAPVRPHRICDTCGHYKNHFYKGVVQSPKVKKKGKEETEQKEQN